MRRFNTEGPVRPEKHYCIPPLARVDLDNILGLIRDDRYFVLHAPRQTGKTSVLLALRDTLNRSGKYNCVYVNIEVGQAGREDTARSMRAVLGRIASRARMSGDGFLEEVWTDILARHGPDDALCEALTRWAEAGSKPLVLLIDEIDALVGDTLLSVLRQLRSGYDLRPDGFPQSIVLCGVRDVRDHRIRSGSRNEVVAGGSAFNIKAESLRLGDFTEAETRNLLLQHTIESGQPFTQEALDTVWEQTQGQPWLVNALCGKACRAGPDPSHPVGREEILNAQEHLILSGQTHLDQLADKLREDRVRRVIGPLLSGDQEHSFSSRDIEYVRDLGLIARDPPLRIANPIYAETVPRELTRAVQEGLVQEMSWYVDSDGMLDMDGLLAAFQAFHREHSEHWLGRFDYREAGPQLLLQAFLQRVVNGGGRIEREYGLGRGRTDLMVAWSRPPAAGSGGVPGNDIRFVIECKVLHRRDGIEGTVRKGIEQTYRYMDRCRAQTGHLVIFDPDGDRSWEDKVFRREEFHRKHRIVVWGM